MVARENPGTQGAASALCNEQRWKRDIRTFIASIGCGLHDCTTDYMIRSVAARVAGRRQLQGAPLFACCQRALHCGGTAAPLWVYILPALQRDAQHLCGPPRLPEGSRHTYSGCADACMCACVCACVHAFVRVYLCMQSCVRRTTQSTCDASPRARTGKSLTQCNPKLLTTTAWVRNTAQTASQAEDGAPKQDSGKSFSCHQDCLQIVWRTPPRTTCTSTRGTPRKTRL